MTQRPEPQRLDQLLVALDLFASRSRARDAIQRGTVKVNGKTITSPALNVTAKDKITVRGEPVGQPEPPRLWLYYKPEGLVTSASDEKGRDTVFDHLPEDLPRVMSVGRLDLNSEGLLLLTNDGELKRRLELPSTGWLRKYRVRIKGNPTDPELEPLRAGIVVDGDQARVAMILRTITDTAPDCAALPGGLNLPGRVCQTGAVWLNWFQDEHGPRYACGSVGRSSAGALCQWRPSCCAGLDPARHPARRGLCGAAFVRRPSRG